MKRFLALLMVVILLSGCSIGTPTPQTAPTTPLSTVGPTNTPATGGAQASSAPSAAPASAAGTRSATSTAPVTGRTTPSISTQPSSAPGTPLPPTPRSAVNVTAVPNTTPAAGEALIEEAVNNILDNYVDPIQSGLLYQTAYDGAVATLRASGKSPQPQTLTFTNDRKRDAATFKPAYLALTQNAGSDINQSVVAYEAIRAFVAKIDECHTYFLDPEQNARAKAQNAGQENYTGIGVLINAALVPATIIKVYPGSPAEQAGLREGDAIIAVDGVDVSQTPVDQVSPLVRGPEGTQVHLTVQRPGEAAPLEFTITRATITVPNFTKKIIDGPNGEKIGYMELASFSATTTRTGVGDGVEVDIQNALDEFEKAGVKYWMLDLRNNPGGYVETLRRVASRFISNGQPVAYYVEESGSQQAINTDRKSYFNPQHPFAVLINAGSASSSEAFAAAAQDYTFARTFGQTSSGCLAAARSFDLADGSAINITVEKVISPKKREINRVGVKPDQEIPLDPARTDDPTLQAAIAWLVGQKQP
jgi:carboxyl-terminal processing protease